jgi:hypothetical protein
MLAGTVRDAEALRLPHQMQRIIRLAQRAAICSADQHLSEQAQVSLLRLDRQLSEAASSP